VTPPSPDERARPWFVPAGVVIGFAGALCGIGGGIFAVPLLHGACKLPLKRATATAILVVLATTVTSTATELLRADSGLDWAVVVPLALGALAGAELGFAVSKRIDERALKRIFAFVLVLAGARVALFTTAIGGAEPVARAASVLIALAIGVAGGVLTPLLGVGGGILMVPALFLALGELGFGGARASALAAGAVAALRALLLHARAGNVRYAAGMPLALGALVGAAGGVVAAHEPALAHAPRVLLGLVLSVQGARFFLELRRPVAGAAERA
jgi:hypothetical protein